MTKSVGLVLIDIGLVVILWGGFGFNNREKVLDSGPRWNRDGRPEGRHELESLHIFEW